MGQQAVHSCTPLDLATNLDFLLTVDRRKNEGPPIPALRIHHPHLPLPRSRRSDTAAVHPKLVSHRKGPTVDLGPAADLRVPLDLATVVCPSYLQYEPSLPPIPDKLLDGESCPAV